MAQQQQNITIAAPGFKGLNTYDSPISLGPEWASIADNVILDKYGRIGSRPGYSVLTTDNSGLGTDTADAIHEFIAVDGTKIVFTCSNNKIFSGTTTLTDETGAAVITADDWSIATLNDDCFFFQTGHAPLVYDKSAGALDELTAHANYGLTTAPQANVVLGAFGRIWCGDTVGDTSTLYWSNLLVGPDFDGGDSGSLDLTEVWPQGYDEIVGLAAHSNHLIIFGKESILIYGSVADDRRIGNPAADLYRADTITGIGLVARNAVRNVGNDLYFLDKTGIRSLSGVVRDKELPVGDISKNVRTDIRDDIASETGIIWTAYSPDDAFFLVCFPTSMKVYCFDMRVVLEDGSRRVTTWTGFTQTAATVLQDGTLYYASNDGVSEATTYLDDDDTYLMRWYTNPLTFGAPSTIKIPKQVDMTIIGGASKTVTLKWAYDFRNAYAAQTVVLPATGGSEYGEGEYGIAEYGSTELITTSKVNVTGSGTSLTVGIESTINATSLSIQELNVQALIGRLV